LRLVDLVILIGSSLSATKTVIVGRHGGDVSVQTPDLAHALVKTQRTNRANRRAHLDEGGPSSR
jgi:hypothetical protein